MTPNEKPIDNKTKVQSKRQYVELSCFFEAYKVEHITLIQVHDWPTMIQC